MVSMFLVTLSTIVRRWRELSCPSTDEERRLAICTVCYYSAMARSEGQTFPITMRPQNTAQTQKLTQCMTLFIWGSRGCKPRETEGRQEAERAEPEEGAAFWVIFRVFSGMQGDEGVTDSGCVCMKAKCHQLACVRMVDIMLYEFWKHKI